jgi:hypothetical protein
MEVGIERLAALAFIITGLSHITAPRAWTRFFLIMRDQGEAAGLPAPGSSSPAGTRPPAGCRQASAGAGRCKS